MAPNPTEVGVQLGWPHLTHHFPSSAPFPPTLSPTQALRRAMNSQSVRRYSLRAPASIHFRQSRWATCFEGTAELAPWLCVDSPNPESDSQQQQQQSTSKVLVKRYESAIHSDVIVARQLYHELQAMHHLRHHPNIVHLVDVLMASEQQKQQNPRVPSLVIVTELTDLTLDVIFRSPQPLAISQIRSLMYQLLFGLEYMHKAGIAHHDLTPANLLVTRNCELKIAHFGISPLVWQRTGSGWDALADSSVHHYHSPEQVLGCPYTTINGFKGDMWSVGCILGQMFNKTPSGKYPPLFAGRTCLEQLDFIISFTGTPSEEDLSSINSTDSQAYIRKYLSGRVPCDVAAKLHLPFDTDNHANSSDPALVHEIAHLLSDQLLVFHPEKRCSAKEAMQSSFFASVYDPKDVEHHPGLFYDDAFDDLAAVRGSEPTSNRRTLSNSKAAPQIELRKVVSKLHKAAIREVLTSALPLESRNSSPTHLFSMALEMAAQAGDCKAVRLLRKFVTDPAAPCLSGEDNELVEAQNQP